MSEYRHNTNPRDLEPHFSQHMMALTAEELYRKAEIAIELAYRDKRIALLESVAEAAVQFWTRDYVWDLDELYLALRAAGYLKDA